MVIGCPILVLAVVSLLMLDAAALVAAAAWPVCPSSHARRTTHDRRRHTTTRCDFMGAEGPVVRGELNWEKEEKREKKFLIPSIVTYRRA